MTDYNWLYILYLLASVPSLYIVSRLSLKERSLSGLYFSLAVLSFIGGILISLAGWIEDSYVRGWSDIIAITLVQCGLFVMIRNSKPVFARFPIYLTALPVITLFFYPIVSDIQVVTDLLKMTYQGGAILVGILVIAINHYLHRQREVLLLSCTLFLLAYILYWTGRDNANLALASSVLMSFGFITGSAGLKKITTT